MKPKTVVMSNKEVEGKLLNQREVPEQAKIILNESEKKTLKPRKFVKLRKQL